MAARHSGDDTLAGAIDSSAKLMQVLIANRDRLNTYAVTHVNLNDSQQSRMGGLDPHRPRDLPRVGWLGDRPHNIRRLFGQVSKVQLL